MSDLLERQTLLLRTLGHPLRLRIVARLAESCCCVREMWEGLGLPQAVVSQQLKILREHGIVASRRQGKQVCYTVSNDTARELARLLFPGGKEACAGDAARRGASR